MKTVTTANWSVELVDASRKEYEQARHLAQKVYRESYGAELNNRPPSYFVYLEHDSNYEPVVKACMSCTPIINGNRLFSERYLEMPVEQYLAIPVLREKILEIGSFASLGDPFSTWNVMRSSVFLGYIVHKWSHALVTVTPQVKSMLKRCQMEFVQIGQASMDCLEPSERGLWGNYYDQSPSVCLIDIHASLLNNLPSLVSTSNLALSISGSRV